MYMVGLFHLLPGSRQMLPGLVKPAVSGSGQGSHGLAPGLSRIADNLQAYQFHILHHASPNSFLT